jgi:hypothetical protein
LWRHVGENNGIAQAITSKNPTSSSLVYFCANMRKTLLILSLFVFVFGFAQSPLTTGYFNYHLVDRYEVLSGEFSSDLFTTVKPYRRDAVSAFAEKIAPISRIDSFNKQYLLNDNILFNANDKGFREKPFFKSFYKTQTALIYVSEDRFKLIVNPLIGVRGATDSGDTLSLYNNSRGAEVRGSIGNKVGFYSYVTDNQARFPNYNRDRIRTSRVVNGTTLHKPFGTLGEDYFNAAGYITVSPIEEIMVQFGQDKNFIGNGYRSLILSDIAAPYPFLKINTKVWKLNYTNLFSQHTDFISQGESATNGKKFSALHHLSINITKNLNIGFFENIIFDRKDSTEGNRYELAYLNPLIFYRAVEHGLNSSDNAVLGLDWKWNFKKHYSFYGQLILDEFVKDQLFGRTQSWVNKWAYQAGIKYFNVANINNLDLQLEVNQLRPYIYQHRTKSQNWIHYNQSLAHPLGTNLREFIGIIRYQPLNRLNIQAIYSLSVQGIDSSISGTNYGGNYLRTYDQRPANNVNPMFNGVKNTIATTSIDASYMLWHNFFVDAGFVLRTNDNLMLPAPKNNTIIYFGLRLNTAAFDYRQ